MNWSRVGGKQVTKEGKYTYVEYARYADDLVVLVDAYRRHAWSTTGSGRKSVNFTWKSTKTKVDSWTSRKARALDFSALTFAACAAREVRGEHT
jgi:RNA-directed DNA polymerase